MDTVKRIIFVRNNMYGIIKDTIDNLKDMLNILGSHG